MSTSEATIGATGVPAWREALGRVPRDTLGLRLATGAVAVIAAYHYSLLTLMRNLGLDTPLAYLGLVPIISVGIAMLLPRGAHLGPDIHDRQLDLILGLPLVAGTVIALHVLPVRLSAFFWTSRLDLLTLPFFVFGVSVLLFGLRTTWRFRVPVAFLFLAWPLPYTVLIDRTLQLTTDSTIAGVKQALTVIAVAVPAGGDGSLFRVLHGATGATGGGGGDFTVSIASACAGVNSLVGFIIVGTAFLALVRPKPPRGGGPTGRGLLRKGSWLTLGLFLVWALNIVRLMLVLGVGKQWGKTVAIDGLHPVIGMFTFSIAVLLMLVAMPLFGLQVQVAPRSAAAQERMLKRWARGAATRPTVGGMRLAGVAVVAASGLLVGTNSSFAHFELVAGDLSRARLTGFTQHPSQVPGFSASKIDQYDWVQQFFGSSSTWDRFQYYGTGEANPALPAGFASTPVIADVIEGSKLTPFNAYGIEACYTFHGYDTSKQERVDLGGGVYGGSISFRDPHQTVTFNVVYWVWPVQTPQGRRYERVALLQQNGVGSGATPTADSSPFQGVGNAAPVGPAAGGAAGALRARNQAALVAFARQVVAHQAAAPSAPTAVSAVRS